MMYRPIFDYELIKELIERQNHRVEVVKLSYMTMPSYDSQTYCVLEWFNGREYAIRMYYVFLTPLTDGGGLQPLGSGSGGYLLLMDKERDRLEAIEEFDKTAKAYKEDM